MNAQPVVRCGGTLVVLEGSRRVRWRRTAAAEWVPDSIWPSAEQADEVLDRIARNEPVLILLSAEPSIVQVMSEEFVQAPPALKALALEPDSDPVTLVIPYLDWLPRALRQRGLRFGRLAGAVATATPRALLPPLMLEPPDPHMAALRFGLRRSSAVPVGLAAIVRAAFPSVDHAYTGGTSGSTLLEVQCHGR